MDKKKTEINKDIKNLQEELDQALLSYAKSEEEVAKLKEQILRVAAEGENFRKRCAKQTEETSKFAVNNFAKDLIDVLENLYLATDNIPKEDLENDSALANIFKGVEMTKTTLLNIFDKHGIKRIFPEVGEAFDHNLHQAVAHIEDPNLNENSVVSVMRAGYSLHNRLIKPAMVVVSKA
ncbi:MAG: nucleotide exchange factor GrpE [Pseudomonadota bacterium]